LERQRGLLPMPCRYCVTGGLLQWAIDTACRPISSRAPGGHWLVLTAPYWTERLRRVGCEPPRPCPSSGSTACASIGVDRVRAGQGRSSIAGLSLQLTPSLLWFRWRQGPSRNRHPGRLCCGSGMLRPFPKFTSRTNGLRAFGGAKSAKKTVFAARSAKRANP
jgi:hypothetical protein